LHKLIRFRYQFNTLFPLRYTSTIHKYEVNKIESFDAEYKNENNHSSDLLKIQNPIPDFHTNELALKTKSTLELIRAAITFGLCTVPPLVRNAESIVKLSYRIFGSTITNQFLRISFYSHFCGGQDLQDIQPTIQRLKIANIGCILDFAAEDDNEHDTATNVDKSITKYYRNFERFQQSISYVTESGADISSRNFIAIKVTALCEPIALGRLSNVLNMLNKCEIPHHEKHIFDDFVTSRQLPQLDFTQLQDIPAVVTVLSDVTPTKKDIEALDRMYEYCNVLAQMATQHGAVLLFDAEQVRFQPAINALVLHLQRTYNSIVVSDYPVIYNTYQCYLKDTENQFQSDLELSKKFEYHMGVKLVRGAYMESERSLAMKLGVPSPIHNTIQDTHFCYNNTLKNVLQNAKHQEHIGGPSLEVMCGTHNQESIEYAIRIMNELSIDRKSNTINFAQLYGMKDNLTYNLGLHRYNVYKYVPYGEIQMVTPYLLRRANENSAIRGGVKDELNIIITELYRRAKVKIGF
jgi:proline dehydrogenase